MAETNYYLVLSLVEKRKKDRKAKAVELRYI